MAKITYTNKANLNSLSSINAENKVSDTDMNEIKSVVNDNYDDLVNKTQAPITSGGDGVACGYTIDNKPVYVKRFNFGSLPNATSKSVATGIDFDNYMLVKIEGIAKYATNNIAFAIPFAHPTNLANSIMVNIDASNNLVITTGVDRRGYNGYINIYYM